MINVTNMGSIKWHCKIYGIHGKYIPIKLVEKYQHPKYKSERRVYYIAYSTPIHKI